MTPRPLEGLRVVVTRAEHQAEDLAAALAAAGASVELLPLLAVLPPEDPEPLAAAAASLESYRWVVFTSANAVRALLARMKDRWPAHTAVAAVGEATDAALCDEGVGPSIVAARTTGEGLLEELLERLARPAGPNAPATPPAGVRILLPQAADARPTLAAGLRAAGYAVDTVVAYRKTLPPDAPARAASLFGDGPLGWVTFTSPSIARGFAGLFGADWASRRGSLRAASIGPVTTEALRMLGVTAAAEASTASDAAMAAAIVAAASRPVAPRR